MAQPPPIKGHITVDFDQPTLRLLRAMAKNLEKLANPKKEMLILEEDTAFIVGDTVYADANETYLLWNSEKYYRRCGAPVSIAKISVCVLPIHHEGVDHVDWYGNLKEKRG